MRELAEYLGRLVGSVDVPAYFRLLASHIDVAALPKRMKLEFGVDDPGDEIVRQLIQPLSGTGQVPTRSWELCNSLAVLVIDYSINGNDPYKLAYAGVLYLWFSADEEIDEWPLTESRALVLVIHCLDKLDADVRLETMRVLCSLMPKIADREEGDPFSAAAWVVAAVNLSAQWYTAAGRSGLAAIRDLAVRIQPQVEEYGAEGYEENFYNSLRKLKRVEKELEPWGQKIAEELMQVLSTKHLW